MAFKTKENLDWTDVDTDDLSAPLAKLHKAYRTAQDTANKARDAFDAAFKKVAGEKLKIDVSEQSIVVGHKWGKLSYAVSNTPSKDAPKKIKAFF